MSDLNYTEEVRRSRVRLSVAVLTVGAFISVGTVIFRFLEDWTWIQAFYFTVATISTVGYGDLAPSNDLTRLCVAIYILLSVAAVASAFAIMGNSYIASQAHRHHKM